MVTFDVNKTSELFINDSRISRTVQDTVTNPSISTWTQNSPSRQRSSLTTYFLLKLYYPS